MGRGLRFGRLEEAIAAYDKAIEIKPDYYQAWNNRGNALHRLESLEEAIVSFDKAIEIKPDYYQAWEGRGYAMYSSERYQEAIANFDKVLQIKPHNCQIWNNRGYLLLKKYSFEGMTVVYNKPLEINRNLSYKQFSTKELEIFKEALDNFNESIEQQPDFSLTWANRSFALYCLDNYDETIYSCDKAIEFNLEEYKYVPWCNKAFALINLKQYEEAIISFDKVLEMKPDYTSGFYNKACCYALQNNIEQAIENLQIAITLNPKECQEMAKNDSCFDAIRNYKRFQELIHKA